MKPFKHHNAKSIKEATTLLKGYEGKAKFNAGGTDLLGAMRDKCMAEYPEAVINIKTIKGLDYIRKDKAGLRIGALTKLADVAGSPEVKEEYKLLAETAYAVASPHIRNMATMGGNIAQEVRCWYYRYPEQIGGAIKCLRKGGKVCSALAGDNRYHSLFGAAPLAENPCASQCPAHTNIPAYLNKVQGGNLAEAARILMDYNPIPAVTGRICPVFCEPECNRREYDDPVAIQCIERGVGDYVLENPHEFYFAPEKKTGKKVAIVGSGPAGLSAAFYLRKSGHWVTVYERLPEAGGMLTYSIPPFRLPKDIIRKQVKALEDMGIIFETGVNVGKDITMKQLEGRFDAVFVAGGTWKPLKLGVPGEDAGGVLLALDYLREINSGKKVPLGKKVIVIGGGSVAIDAARTAKRSGAEEVHLVCLECRDLTSKDRMLALDNEIFEAEEEGIIIHASLGVKEITAKNGKATGLDAVTCLSVREEDGSFNPQLDNTCTALDLRADSIIVAIGQVVDQSLVPQGIACTPKGTVAVDGESGGTDKKNVFAGGDMVSGATTVIQAVASARDAVRAMELRLGGAAKTLAGATDKSCFSESVLRDIPRARVHELPAAVRLKTIDVEDVQGLSLDEIGTEAGRCFNCGCLAVGPSDIAMALVALDARVVTSKRSVPAQAFFNASAASSTILDEDELIKEIRIPKPGPGARQIYEKFTLRKPIDFAIVSVASVVTVKDGVCKDARIVLGAVAPEPMRARAAEEFLKGRELTEAAAGRAGDLAVEGAVPLAQNSYKIEIARTLVKRAIMA